MLNDHSTQVKLFISYSHDDEHYFNVFIEGLKKIIKNSEYFEWQIWSDKDIHIGTFWDEEIQNNIKECNVALLLVSVGFMASKYIKENEFKQFAKRYEDRNILIIPILFLPCDFTSWIDLEKLQIFKPKGYLYGKPEIENFTYADLISFTQKDGIFIPIPNPNINRYHLDLVKNIEATFKKFLTEKKDSNINSPKKTITVNKLFEAPKPRTYFTGREVEIQEFKKAIDDGTTFITIDGPGGIGKTQFASRCIEKYIFKDKLIWYDCTIASHFDTLISEAGYPELLRGSSKTDREKFSAFKDKIQENELYLFLDNFQETNSNPTFRQFLLFIQEYLKKGCVIVIDRDDIRSIDLIPKRIHIEGFKSDKLIYAKALIEHAYKEDVIISDTELEMLCEQLKGYPLAIDFAIYLLNQGEVASEILTKIVYENDDVQQISERLLNSIFSRSDSTNEEKDFIRQFSVFTGSVSEKTVKGVIPEILVKIATRKLQRKNLLSYSNGYYEVHPLVRQFCYNDLIDKENTHAKAAESYIEQRTLELNPALEEQIFYHLAQSKQWERIEKQIEEKGRQFIMFGQLGLVIELLEKLKKIGIEKPVFNILFGDIAEIQGKWDEAEAFFSLAQSNSLDNKVKAEGIVKFGEILFRKGNLSEALLLFEEAFTFSKLNNFLKEEARALNDIGLVYDCYGDIETSYSKFTEAFTIQTSINDQGGIISSLINLGSIYETRAELDEALIKYEQGLEIAETIGDKSGIAASLCSIGGVYRVKGELDKSLKTYLESLKIQETIGDKSGIGNSLSCIGSIYELKQDLDKALKIFEKSYKIAQEIRDKSGIGNALNDIGGIHQLKGEYEKAFKNFNESLEISKELKNKASIAVSLNNIGLVYRGKEQFEKALEKYEESLKIKEEIGNKLIIANTLYNIGIIYIENTNKQFDLALSYLFKSLALFIKIGDKRKSEANINDIIFIRDQNMGLEKFKISAQKACLELELEMQKYIPLKDFLKEPFLREEPKMGRNDLCNCGSGKKNKHCCKKN